MEEYTEHSYLSQIKYLNVWMGYKWLVCDTITLAWVIIRNNNNQ